MATLKWIGLRPARKAQMVSVTESEVNNLGLVGDHYRKENGNRNITLIKSETIADVWGNMNLDGDPDPGQMRRNLVVEGLPEGDFNDIDLHVGDEVVLTITGECRPCSRMNQNLGHGGLVALSGKGGFTAKVKKGGIIRVGDQIVHKSVPEKVKRYLP